MSDVKSGEKEQGRKKGGKDDDRIDWPSPCNGKGNCYEEKGGRWSREFRCHFDCPLKVCIGCKIEKPEWNVLNGLCVFCLCEPDTVVSRKRPRTAIVHASEKESNQHDLTLVYLTIPDILLKVVKADPWVFVDSKRREDEFKISSLMSIELQTEQANGPYHLDAVLQFDPLFTDSGSVFRPAPPLKRYVILKLAPHSIRSIMRQIGLHRKYILLSGDLSVARFYLVTNFEVTVAERHLLGRQSVLWLRLGQPHADWISTQTASMASSVVVL
jgi:hypothetical protein